MAHGITPNILLLAGVLILGGLQVQATVCPCEIGLETVARQRPGIGIAQALDAEVKSFLDGHRYSWHDMNVPEEDGLAISYKKR
jgi:hypothetical protein